MIWVFVTASVVRDERGRPLHVVRQLLDISSRKSTEARLRDQADVDPLTQTLNRRGFQAVLAAGLERARTR